MNEPKNTESHGKSVLARFFKNPPVPERSKVYFFIAAELLTKMYTLFYHVFWNKEVLHAQSISTGAT